MGNHAKRRALALVLKEQKHGVKLYRGNKKKAYRYLRSAHCQQMLDCLKFKPGDRIQDCNGFNCTLDYWYVGKSSGHRNFHTVQVSQFRKTDGTDSCGCGFVEPALSPEDITKYWSSWQTCEADYPWIQFMKTGLPIFTETGEMSKEYKEFIGR